MIRSAKNGKTMLAILCGKRKGTSASILTKIPKASSPDKKSDSDNPLDCSTGAFAARNLAGVGQIEVHVLESPKIDELKQAIESLEPDIVYFQGESVAETDDIGPLEVADGQIFSPEGIVALFGDIVPELVYLEAGAASKLGDALQSKGVPYVIFWKGQVTFPCAAHFRHALLAVLGSCSSHVWSAFQLAFASFKFHFGSFKVQGISENASKNVRICPVILGEPPPKSLEPPKPKDSADNDGLPANLAKVQIYDEDLDLPLLVFAESHGQEGAADYGMLEDGLNTLLTVEVKGMRFLHRVSASPPPSSAPTLVRGVVTMRCDLCSSSSARISLLISGSAQTCFDEQMLEYSIKKQLLERGKLVCLLSKSGDTSVADMRKSASIACGALVREVKFRCSSWAVQVLRQLAPDLSFRSLVALGIAGVQGFPVAAFQKEDTDRFRALKVKKQELVPSYNSVQIPSWLTPPPPTVKRQKIQSIGISSKNLGKDIASPQLSKNQSLSPVNLVAAMRPVPHVHSNRDMPFAGSVVAGAHSAWTMKVSVPNSVGGKLVRPNASTSAVAPSASPSLPVSHSRQNVRAPSPAQVFSLNTVSMKKHGCSRPPMQECSEEEFRKDVMQFLISRGHGRLVPSSDLDAFPDAVLNGKKLDLYNLYKEVVSRGGFHVGNGINWKGQVFSKMSNHTLINKMTGVGNTLKKHYETYLLEYELAHDDVDGECCILCHSSAAGDWVNCGICGEWAHLGCDKRSGLGAFKEYAKTDGLEYICPRCSASNARSGSGKKRFRSTANGAS